VTKVLPAVVACMAPRFTGAILIKPQFEAGPKDVGKGGIVRSMEVHRRVLTQTAEAVITGLGVDLVGICRSAVPGTGGNREFFFHLERGGARGLTLDTLEDTITTVLEKDAPAGGGDEVHA
jgi:23S rRNA (cytidine1920-2'-O)/16S rRNA (cytidine1409-2'-O)-methyltransferase